MRILTVALMLAVLAAAQTPPGFGQPPGAGLFQQNCARCHAAQGLEMDGRTAPTLASLRALGPEKLYEAMVNGGKMQTQATALTDRDKRNVAEFLAAKRIAESGAEQQMTNQCASNPTLNSRLDFTPAWNGWGPEANNARFQTAAIAKLTPADV